MQFKEELTKVLLSVSLGLTATVLGALAYEKRYHPEQYARMMHDNREALRGQDSSWSLKHGNFQQYAPEGLDQYVRNRITQRREERKNDKQQFLES